MSAANARVLLLFFFLVRMFWGFYFVICLEVEVTASFVLAGTGALHVYTENKKKKSPPKQNSQTYRTTELDLETI